MKIKNILIFSTLLLILIVPVLANDYVVVGNDVLDGRINEFLSTPENKLSMIIPAMFLIIALIAFMIDFGAIGVIGGSILSLVVLSIMGIIAINFIVITSYILLGIMLMFKMRG